jgi:hypothetical protein
MSVWSGEEFRVSLAGFPCLGVSCWLDGCTVFLRCGSSGRRVSGLAWLGRSVGVDEIGGAWALLGGIDGGLWVCLCLLAT